MFFDDWQEHKAATFSKALFWEFDLASPNWDWQKMRKTVVARVIERGREEDYHAMFHLYGGLEPVKEIVKTVPYLSEKDMNWCCVLFNLKHEDLWSYRRALSRKQLLHSWQNS